MKKQTARMYGKTKKTEKSFVSDGHNTAASALERYPIKQEQEIEKILSPFWAWRSLNG